MKVENIELLKKIIAIQACIIQGRGLKAILHLEQEYLLNFVNAKIITICIIESEKMYMEHIFEKDKVFEHNIKEYILRKKNFKCDSIMKNYEKCLPKNKTHYISESFYDTYKTAISKKEAEEFKYKVLMKEFVIMPISDIKDQDRIGYVTFIFDEKNKYELEKIKDLRSFFEALIQPMYDSDENILFPECVRVDRHFHALSTKEKIIIKKVIKGESYIDISEDLNVSINTIKSHMKNIFNKYAVHSKIELYNKITNLF
jgi:DNA-binding CsgD family transcriptional regulator